MAKTSRLGDNAAQYFNLNQLFQDTSSILKNPKEKIDASFEKSDLFDRNHKHDRSPLILDLNDSKISLINRFDSTDAQYHYHRIRDLD